MLYIVGSGAGGVCVKADCVQTCSFFLFRVYLVYCARESLPLQRCLAVSLIYGAIASFCIVLGALDVQSHLSGSKVGGGGFYARLRVDCVKPGIKQIKRKQIKGLQNSRPWRPVTYFTVQSGFTLESSWMPGPKQSHKTRFYVLPTRKLRSREAEKRYHNYKTHH